MKTQQLITLSFFMLINFSLAHAEVGGQKPKEVNTFRQHTNKSNPLFGYLVGPGTAKLDKPVLRPFSSDGCSQSPNVMLGYAIVDCCVQHDVAYWLGGTREEKQASDQELRSCIAKNANPTIARMYYDGVNIGGSAKRANTFRWGYGWDQIRPYSAITPDEMGQAEKMYGKDIYKLKEMVANKKYVINFELLTLDFLNVNRFFDDKLVYYFLQNTLKRLDIVSHAAKMRWMDYTWYYQVRLQSCGDKRVYIKINRTQILWDMYFGNLNIDTAPWSELQKYIGDVVDGGGCLK